MKTKILKLSVSTIVLTLLAFSHTTYAADSGWLISYAGRKCADVPGFNFVPHQVVQNYTCNGGINQQWTYGQDSHQFQSRGNPSLCLSGEMGTRDRPEPVHLDDCIFLSRSEWEIAGNQFVNVALGQCIDRNGATSGQLRVATCSGLNTSANQKFVVSSGHAIQVTGTNACWDVPNGIPGENVPINLFSCHSGTNQKWIISEGGVIRYQPDETFCVAINAQSKLALSQECDTAVVQWVIRGPLVATFGFDTPVCLTSNTQDGTALRATSCSGGLSQIWDYWP